MTFDKKELSDSLEKIRMFATNTALSILSTVRIRGKELIASDLRKSVIMPTADFGFDACVDLRKFLALVKKSRYEEIDISYTDKVLVIDTPEYRAEIVTEDPEKFPDVVMPSSSDFNTLPATFRGALSMCSGFTSKDESRYFMTGVHTDGRSVVATDGRRLAKYELGDGVNLPSMIIPTDAVETFMAMDVDTYFHDEDSGKLFFNGPDGMFSVNLIDGQFVDYNKVIVTEETPEAVFELDQEALAGSDIVKIFDDADEERVVVQIEESGLFTISREGDRGRILFRHELEDYEGPSATFTINYGYLVAAAQVELMKFEVYRMKIHIESGPYLAVVALVQATPTM